MNPSRDPAGTDKDFACHVRDRASVIDHDKVLPASPPRVPHEAFGTGRRTLLVDPWFADPNAALHRLEIGRQPADHQFSPRHCLLKLFDIDTSDDGFREQKTGDPRGHELLYRAVRFLSDRCLAAWSGNSTVPIASRSTAACSAPCSARMSDASPSTVVFPDPIDPEITMTLTDTIRKPSATRRHSKSTGATCRSPPAAASATTKSSPRSRRRSRTTRSIPARSRKLASLNHPHIAQICGVEDAAPVMELVDGEDLAHRILRSA